MLYGEVSYAKQNEGRKQVDGDICTSRICHTLLLGREESWFYPQTSRLYFSIMELVVSFLVQNKTCFLFPVCTIIAYYSIAKMHIFANTEELAIILPFLTYMWWFFMGLDTNAQSKH